jgi:AAA family ATP:ADP antiporter
VLPFLVPYGVLPASMIFVLLYTYLSIHLSRRALFNIIVFTFTAYFVLFTVSETKP